jgi:competence protein ComEC
MLSRPLVPALFATIIGVLIGHSIPANVNLPAIFLPATILLLLGVFFIMPAKIHPFWYTAIFILIGINSQISESITPELRHLTDNNEKVVIEGTIYAQPRIRTNTADLAVRSEKIFFAQETKKIKANLLVKIYRHRYGADLKAGDKIRFPAKLKEFKNFNNPGSFDYKFYMKSRGFCLSAIVSDGRYVVPMGKGDLGLIGKALEKIRGPVRKFFKENLSYALNPIYSALILGERQNLTSEIREPFDRSGTGHVMAVSGLHLGFVTWLFFSVLIFSFSLSYRLTLMTDIKKLAAIITTFPVIGYGLISGFQIPSQRAMIMILTFLWSFIIDREKDVWSSFSLAAIIILILNSDSLFTVSFQLSFTAVAGILWLAPPIFSGILKIKAGNSFLVKNKIIHKALVYLIGLIAVTAAATIITTPLIAHYFHRFSVIALPANLTVVPIIGLWVIPLGLLSSVSLFFSSGLADFFLSLGESGLTMAVSIAKFWSAIPWGSAWIIRPGWLEIILLYGLLFCGLNVARSKVYRLCLASILILVFIDTGHWVYQARFNKVFEITILDTGRESASYVRFPGNEKMIIAGNIFGYRGRNLDRKVVAPFLWHKKIWRIDHIFLMGSSDQKTDGLEFMSKAFRPKEILSNDQEEKVIAGAKIKGNKTDGIILTYRGWSFLFHDKEVWIERLSPKEKNGWHKCLVTGKKSTKSKYSFPVFNLNETGATTITIDSTGNIKMKSFLKEGSLDIIN